MTANADKYSDSTPQDKPERPVNTWQPVGDLARALVEKAVAKCEK